VAGQAGFVDAQGAQLAGEGVEDAVGGPLGVPGDAADQSGQVDRRTEVDPYGRAAPQRRQHGGDHQPR